MSVKSFLTNNLQKVDRCDNSSLTPEPKPSYHSLATNYLITTEIRNCSQLLPNLRRSPRPLLTQLRATREVLLALPINIKRTLLSSPIRIQREQRHKVQSQECHNRIEVSLPSVRVRSRESRAARRAASEGSSDRGVNRLRGACELDRRLDGGCQLADVCAADGFDCRTGAEDHECWHAGLLSAAEYGRGETELTL
jgi:hypothetical protein